MKLKKKLGQNFLIDKNIIKKEIAYAGDLNCVVLEIGCGTGLLTEDLAKNAKKVIAIEKDSELLKICKERLSNYSNIEYIQADALKIDFPEFDKVVSNLPYSISSDITFKLLKCNFELGVLTYQKEFAERLIAKPGTKDYSRLSVNAYLRAEVEILDKVSRNCFYPKPKVNSVIVRIKPKKGEIARTVGSCFDNLLRALFQHKNKLVKNALRDSSHLLDMNKEEIKKLQLPHKKVLMLTPEEIIKLAETIQTRT